MSTLSLLSSFCYQEIERDLFQERIKDTWGKSTTVMWESVEHCLQLDAKHSDVI